VVDTAAEDLVYMGEQTELSSAIPRSGALMTPKDQTSRLTEADTLKLRFRNCRRHQDTSQRPAPFPPELKGVSSEWLLAKCDYPSAATKRDDARAGGAAG
jgi:hypothetical protein